MDTAIILLQRYGLLLVFFNLLLTEGGLPIPAYPTLVTAGALGAASGLGLSEIIVTGAAATMVADLSWFAGARKRGRGMLRTLCRLSLSPESCVRQTESLFGKIGPWSLLIAKFVPGLTTITVSLAGMTKTPFALFLLLDLIGASLFVAVPVVAGWLFRDAIADVLLTLAQFGAGGLLVVLLALAAWLGGKWWQRFAFSRQLRMDRITVDELIHLLEGDEPPLILDVRPKEMRDADGVIPGALPGHPAEIDIEAHLDHRDREIVVYCACPNEASAAIACQHLKRAGFKKIRPLLGGVAAWTGAGREVTLAAA
jgi:membrane protein DedA with SNARE-associated domain/rhodanese-related sulfurtransferase